MTSPRDEALTLLRRAREELEGVTAFINSGVGTTRRDRPRPFAPHQIADEQLDVWARVQHATNMVEKIMSELSTLASYEFARVADDRKVSARMANDRRRTALAASDRRPQLPSAIDLADLLKGLATDRQVTLHTPDGDVQKVLRPGDTVSGSHTITTPEENVHKAACICGASPHRHHHTIPEENA